MKRMTSREIRDMWLKYFSERGHLIVPSANLDYIRVVLEDIREEGKYRRRSIYSY